MGAQDRRTPPRHGRLFVVKHDELVRAHPSQAQAQEVLLILQESRHRARQGLIRARQSSSRVAPHGSDGRDRRVPGETPWRSNAQVHHSHAAGLSAASVQAGPASRQTLEHSHGHAARHHSVLVAVHQSA